MIENYEDIQQDVEAILAYSQDYPFDIDCSALMESWARSKAPIVDLFHGNLIIRSKHPIAVELSEEQRSRRFYEYLNVLEENGVLTDDLHSFLLINKDGFFDNRVQLPFPSKHITPGSKLLRSFKHFILPKEMREWAQDKASQYIQESKIEGYLYLSVDPRDFLTLSENNKNWWSCQSLDGDYRAGNLSYMTDEVTMVAYIADEKQEKLRCMPEGMQWNSKKWRMLVHTNRQGAIYYNRQYPYTINSLMGEVHKLVAELLGGGYQDPDYVGFKSINLPDKTTTLLSTNQIMIYGGRCFNADDLINIKDYRGYSDLVHSSSYVPIAALKISDVYNYETTCIEHHVPMIEEYSQLHKTLGIKIGHRVPCVCCGKEDVNRDDKFLCDTCIAEHDADEDYYITCHSCYHRIYDEDIVFDDDDEPYCAKCYKAMQQEDEVTLEEDDFYG